MSTKFRLFASVAAPLVSLPLIVQPAIAMPPKAMVQSAGEGDVIRVQEQLILPPGAAPEGEQPPAEEAPAEEPPAEEAPAEPAPEPAPEAQQEAPAEVQPEAPAPEPEAAPEPEPEPEAAPEPESAPEPEAAPEAPAEEAPAEEAPAEEAPAAEEPAAEQAPAEEAPAEEAPAAEARAEEAPAPEAAPEAEQAPAAEEQAPAAEEQAPAASEEQPAEDAAPSEETPPAADATEQPAEPATGEEAPAADAPAAEAPAAETEGATEAAPAEGTTDGAAEAPADAAIQNGAAAGTDAPALAEEPAVATTPEEVERARVIAEDPSAAQEGETAVLPVENGAAILDSQKEAAPASTTTTTKTTTTTTEGQAPAPAQAAAPATPPTSDAEAQAPLQERGRVELRAATAEEGQRIDGRPDYRRLDGWDYRDGDRRDGDRRDRRDDDGDTRIIISIGDRAFVRGDDTRRFYRDGGDVYYERLPGDRYREVVERPGGVQVVTIRNSAGVVIQRSRIVDGEEYVLYYAPDLYDDEDYVWRDPGRELPPMRLTVPLDDYIIDTSTDPDRDYYEFLEQPPVERVERVYSLDEVRYSARIRDKARRIDLDTITFATGSAEIPMNQAKSLRKVAEAMNKILEENPAETFLIEGHTDAVGSDESNLVLSDERAESVAVVLTEAFGIPPENLATQGYGERYLKIKTEGAEQENRRVTIRRITPLVKPVASNQ